MDIKHGMERLVFLKPVLILVAGSSKGLFALALCSFGTSCVYAASTGIARRTGALGIPQLAVSPPLTLEWLLGTHAQRFVVERHVRPR